MGASQHRCFVKLNPRHLHESGAVNSDKSASLPLNCTETVQHLDSLCAVVSLWFISRTKEELQCYGKVSVVQPR